MVIKKIFKKREKDKIIINSIPNINSVKKQIKKSENEDEDGGFNFRDGFNQLKDMEQYETKLSNKNKITSADEGSNQDSVKNPKNKNNKEEEIYSDFTDKPFIKKEKEIHLENEENISSTNIVLTDVSGNKIAKSVKKNSKGSSTRGI